MFKLELLQNKLYAILLIVCTLPITFVEGDVTALVMASLLAVPMFFAKENWILGGDYENQESRRKDIRSRDVQPPRKKAMELEIRRQIVEYNQKNLNEIDALILWVLHEQFGFGAKRLKQFYNAFQNSVND